MSLIRWVVPLGFLTGLRLGNYDDLYNSVPHTMFQKSYTHINDFLSSKKLSFQFSLNNYPSVFCDESTNFTNESSINTSSINIPFHMIFKKLFQDIRPSVVQILSYEKDNSHKYKFLGTGLIYKPNGMIVTAAHLFPLDATTKTFIIRLDNNSYWECKVRGISQETDIALIEIINPNNFIFPAKNLSLDCSRPGLGEFIASYGTTEYGEEPVAVVGNVSQPFQTFHQIRHKQKCRFIQVGMITLPGMSGAPILNLSGDVIAIMVYKYQEYGLALPSNFVHKVLHSLEKKGYYDPPSLGLVLQHPQPNELPNVIVKEVKNDGPCSKAGLKPGDIISMINGIKVKNLFDLLEQIPGHDKDLITLTVIRDGQILNRNIYL